MSPRAVAATPRTVGAIRKADALPLDIAGGKMGKGAYPATSALMLRWAKVKSKTDDETYVCDIYNNRDDAASESDVSVGVHDLAAGETIPVDTWFMVRKETWNTGVHAASQWTCIQNLGLI